MPRPIICTARFTGWQLVYGLRADLFPTGDAQQRVLGCLDAPTSMPAGAIVAVTDTQFPLIRWANETCFLRAGD